MRQPPRSTLFPYTTLFRSVTVGEPNFLSSTTLRPLGPSVAVTRSEEHTSELQSLRHLVCRLLLEKNILRSHRAPPLLRCQLGRGLGRRGPAAGAPARRAGAARAARQCRSSSGASGFFFL